MTLTRLLAADEDEVVAMMMARLLATPDALAVAIETARECAA